MPLESTGSVLALYTSRRLIDNPSVCCYAFFSSHGDVRLLMAPPSTCAGRLLCEVHEEFQTNIALALRGFWVSPHLCFIKQGTSHS